MTNLSNDLAALASDAPPSKKPGAIALWGGCLVLTGMGAAAALVTWLERGLFGLASLDARLTVLLWILLITVVAIVLYLIAILLGADKATARLFARETGKTGSPSLKKLKRDARLEELCNELRSLLGWRWRYRMPWLMLCGDETRINEVAPGLKQAGVWRSDTAVLVHASPDGIAASLWLKQLRGLRCRPVDGMVQVVPGNQAVAPDIESLRVLAALQTELGWAAPVTFLHPVELKGIHPEEFAAIGTFPAAANCRTDGSTATGLHEALASLETRSAVLGVQCAIAPKPTRFIASISAYIGAHRAGIVNRWTAWQASAWRRSPLAGVMFAPVFATPAMQIPVPSEDAPDDVVKRATAMLPSERLGLHQATLLPTWRGIAEGAKRHRVRRIGMHPMVVLAVLAVVLAGAWSAGMLVSGLRNAQDISTARQTIQAIHTASNAAACLKALLALQQQIERHEHRVQHHAPLATRFGLNRDREVLATLWKSYTQASRLLLVAPVQQDLEASLVDLSQMRTDSLDEQTSRWALGGHAGLKTYLMLAEPERADSAFLAPQLVQHWSTDARITPGEQQDLGERLLKFYAQHLKANPAWRIEPRSDLVAGARQTLLAAIGERNAEDTVYQGIINAFGDNGSNKYPDLNLVSLTAGTDPRGLLRTAAIVPGVFTRQAYEGYVAPAIEAAAKRTEIASDWVLSDGKAQGAQQTTGRSAEALQAALTEQYFADYADRWQGFMNSVQWEAAPTLPAAIDQLTLMADARQSPVIALMKSLEYQGGAGARKDSLSDTLVAKAQDLLGKKAQGPDTAKPNTAGSLGAAFGPVLRLVGQTGQGASGDLSLQRYFDRVTALRLRLQQVSTSADADEQARQMAQALFQGRTSDLADTHAYAQLIAASLGAEWAGMGDALFVRPIMQATQAIVLPAQASLNAAWQRFIVAEWDRTFAGRYPFADTTNDASLPELAQFLRPQGGMINTFLATQLAGVLELQGNQWVPAAGADGITFDPAFLKTINLLQRIGAHMLVQGEPQYRFELKPVPTPGLTDTVLSIDGQKLHYYNQRETWQRMAWPVNNLQEPGTLLRWQTETAGTSKSFEFGGRFALLRMLASGHIEQIDGATYQIGWPAEPDTRSAPEDGAAPSQPMPRMIRFQMRSEAGPGPLEMLSLVGLKMPSRVFLVGKDEAAVQAPSPVAAKARRGGAR
ncbi:type VI secretion protein VasK [Cupriavidus sp. P-10]|uniref:ImcF-related family protein n=1 Tax=Cupriavidus sp. P-10 TaxID=2027911 RepID=UPI000E2F6067|nr:ImcF-related family protein [Cupriavidus sp. P-10]BDB28232.1 type VI secretion protein VasK [Cupriavidus sp. P-10]